MKKTEDNNPSELKKQLYDAKQEIERLRTELGQARKDIENLQKILDQSPKKSTRNKARRYGAYMYSKNHTMAEVMEKYDIKRSTYYRIQNEYNPKKSQKK